MVGQQPRLLILDGNAFIHRAFHGVDPLINSEGIPIAVVSGVKQMVLRLFRLFSPITHCIAVFDPEGPSFRSELYPDYKAQRSPADPLLKEQVPHVHQLFDSLGIPSPVIEGYEADDVIGSVAKQASKYGIPTYIASNDKDLAQLIDSSVSMIVNKNGTPTVLDEVGVLAKFKVLPNQVIDYLTLIGDVADNIPGVNKCGPVTAAKWLAEYGSLQGILDNKESLTGAAGKNFRESLEWLPIAHQLVTVKTDITLGITFADMRVANIENNLEKAHDFYRDLELDGHPREWLS